LDYREGKKNENFLFLNVQDLGRLALHESPNIRGGDAESGGGKKGFYCGSRERHKLMFPPRDGKRESGGRSMAQVHADNQEEEAGDSMKKRQEKSICRGEGTTAYTHSIITVVSITWVGEGREGKGTRGVTGDGAAGAGASQRPKSYFLFLVAPLGRR